MKQASHLFPGARPLFLLKVFPPALSRTPDCRGGGGAQAPLAGLAIWLFGPSGLNRSSSPLKCRQSPFSNELEGCQVFML